MRFMLFCWLLRKNLVSIANGTSKTHSVEYPGTDALVARRIHQLEPGTTLVVRDVPSPALLAWKINSQSRNEVAAAMTGDGSVIIRDICHDCAPRLAGPLAALAQLLI